MKRFMPAITSLVCLGLLLSALPPSMAHEPGDLTVYRWPYDGEGRGLQVVHPDGSGRETITEMMSSFEYSPGLTSISPAGDRVAFDAQDRPHHTHLFVARLDGSGIIQLTRGYRRDMDPSWSPDGDRIVFECEIPICVINADGSGRARKRIDKEYGAGSPEWSPDGRRIALTHRGIETVKPDGTRLKSLTKLRSDSAPHWSPDSRWILFERLYGDRERSLVRVRADASIRERLTTDEAIDTEASWSPDGSRISFMRMMKPGQDGEKWCSYLFVMNADGSDQRDLTGCLPDDGYTNYYPSWSPDGDRIAIIRTTTSDVRESTEDVWAFDLAAGEWQNLTNDEDPYTDYYGLDW